MMFVISKRLYNLIAQVILFVLFVALITPTHVTFIRNVIIFVCDPGSRLYPTHIFIRSYSRALYKACSIQAKM
jgi:hypothetical protein